MCQSTNAVVKMISRRSFLQLCMIISAMLLCHSIAHANDEWSLTVYHGSVSGDGIVDVLQQSANFNYSYNYLAIAASRKIKEQNEHLHWEFEGQFVQHLNRQTHMEFNGLIVVRWLTFPWDQPPSNMFNFLLLTRTLERPPRWAIK